MKQIVLLILLFNLAVACSQKRGGDIPVINLVNHAAIETDTISLSDVASSIKIIPLETNERALVSRIMSIKLHDERIYVVGTNGCMVFDATGKFLNTIGARGRGPQEYVSLYDLFPVRDNLWIIDASGDGKVLKYNINGEFVESFVFDKNAAGVDFYLSSKEEIISYIPDKGQPTTDIMLAFSNSSGIIDSVLYRNPIGNVPVIQVFLYGEAQFVEYGNEMRFKYLFDDTIYNINGHKISPHMRLDLGSRKANEHARVFVKGLESNPTEGMDDVRFLGESESYLYLWINGVPSFYDKAGKSLHKWNFVLPDNEYIDSERIKNFRGMSIDGSGNLIGWVNPANEDDNPVIIIAELR